MNTALTPKQRKDLESLIPTPNFADAQLMGIGRYGGGPQRAFWQLDGLLYSTNVEGYDYNYIHEPDMKQMIWWKRMPGIGW
jgi:hypothetical protein